ncbi:CoA transferase subunit A [Streptomyces sp. RS2]|uniref:CoA transferase subunit A n=1 Tax=Streptomyces sp. RS2 TaxID=1451205 RepID=UPI0021F873DC|nr:CoA-transferase [Streptomyces sp. RS2]MCW1100251.1 CoA transferase subunit A [Streptomyces sp. RS2]
MVSLEPPPRPPAPTARTSKALLLSEAMALVPSEAFVALGGLWFQNNPSAAVHELIRQGTGDLTIVAAPPSSYAVDVLIGAGAVRTAYLAHVSFDHLGMAPNFRRAAETGSIEIIDGDEALILGGLMATLEALPHHPVHSVKSTDLLQRSRLPGPPGQDVAAPVAMRPDVCLLHAQEADMYGNVRYDGTPFCDPLLAKASRKVIVCVDRIVDNDEIRRDPHRTVIPGYLVDAVVETPYGAHPCASQGRYAHDEKLLTAYIAAGRSVAQWRDEYLEPYVLEPRTSDQYLAAVGGAARIERLASEVS